VVLLYNEIAGGRVLRMEPRARGVDYGPAAAGPNPEMDRETRLANNKKYVSIAALPASATGRNGLGYCIP
jgi:hypothetical protein